MAHAAPPDSMRSRQPDKPAEAPALHTGRLPAPTPVYVVALLLLALLVLLTQSVAYAVRPVVQVDLGTYDDSIYLENFHARELDAAASGQAWEWPAARNELSIPGGLQGDQMLTIQAYAHLPERPLSLVALSVNGEPVNIPRSSSHQFTAFVPAELAAAPELHLRLRPALTGGPEPQTGVVEQVVIEPARTYRWSQDESRLVFPGLGRGSWLVDLAVVTAHPGGEPLNAQVFANGVPLATLPESSELRRVHLLVPERAMRGGDLVLTLQSRTYADPRPLGVFVADVTVAPPARSALASSSLPLPVAFSSLVIIWGLYSCLALLVVGLHAPAPRRQRPYWLAALLMLPVIALLTWALQQQRFPTSFMLPGLAGLAVWSGVLLLVLRPLFVRLFPSPQFAHAVLLIFFVSYWLKVAGMLYPYFIAIDVNWHMDRVRWILDGQLPLLYGTDSPLNESTMPVAEWGINRPVIPYSPYFHIFATSFALFPWSLEFTNTMFSALIDVSRIPVVALLALWGGLSQRGALFAALLLAFLPVNFLLHSWGNTPTTFGLWWSLLVTACLVLTWERLACAEQRWPFVLLVGLLLGAFLIYTVAGVFTGMFLVCFSLMLWLAARRDSANTLGGLLLPGLRRLWLATAAAAGIVIVVYYGQYIPPIIERTVPYLVEAFTEGHEDTGRVSDTWSAYLLRHTRLTQYGLVLPLLLGLAYLGWQWASRFRQPLPHPEPPAEPAPPHSGAVLLWAAIAGWVAVMLLFLPLAYTISMVDKHFFVAIPLLVIATAAVLDYGWRRFRVARVAIVLYLLYVGIAAVNLWIMRILTVKQG